MRYRVVVEAPAPNLELYLDRLALEGQVLSNVLGFFKDTLPSFARGLKDQMTLLGRSISQIEPKSTQSLLASYETAKERLPALDFLVFGDRIIMVPEDFTGNLVAYVKTLTEIYRSIALIEKEVIKEYTLMLATFATNKDAKYSIKDHSEFFERIKAERERIQQELHVFFPKDTGKTQRRIRDVLDRWGDLEPLVKETATLNTLVTQTNVHDLQGSVQRAVDMLDVIMGQLKGDEIEKVSPEAAQNIARGAYEVGKYVELFGVIYHDARIAVNVTQQLLNTIITPA